jgi:hypothetical protein
MWRVSITSTRHLLRSSLELRHASTHTPSPRKDEKTTRISPGSPPPPPRPQFTAQAPPRIGPPRLVRHPASESHFDYKPIPRFFAYGTSRSIQRTGSSSTSSTSYLPNRKVPLAEVDNTMSHSSSVNHSNGSALRKRTEAKQSEVASSSWTHSHSHSHSHSHEGSAEEADRLLAALKGKGGCLAALKRKRTAS